MAIATPSSTQPPLPAGSAVDLCLPPRRQAGHVVPEAIGGQPFEIRDWSQLPKDLVASIFSRLELPDLVYSGAVCTSWHLSYLTVRQFRLCSPNQSPYLVYSSSDRDPSTATLHSLSTNKPYHFPLPDDDPPPFRSRFVIGSSHGWLVTADEQADLHLLNPVTGAHIALPPAHTMTGVTPSLAADGTLSGHLVHYLDVQRGGIIVRRKPRFFQANETRLQLYRKAILSSDPSSTKDCTVLLKHWPWEHLSFARVGVDTKWTWLHASERCVHYHDIFHSDRDRLFYAICSSGEIHTIDLNDQTPVVKVILGGFPRFNPYTKYILQAPWGDLLQVWRHYGSPPPDDIPESDDEEQQSNGHVDAEQGDSEVHPVRRRDKLTVHKVDVAKQKVTEIKDLQDHTLFIGFNHTFMVHAREFPNLRPNCVYISDDNIENIYCYPFRGRQFSCLHLGDGTLTDLPFSNSLLHWPPPVWFRPHLT